MTIPTRNPSREAATRVWLVLWKAAHAIEQNAIRSVSALGLGGSDFSLQSLVQQLIGNGKLRPILVSRSEETCFANLNEPKDLA